MGRRCHTTRDFATGCLALALMAGAAVVAEAGLRFTSRNDVILVEKSMTAELKAVTVTMWVKGESNPGNLVVGAVIINTINGLGFYLKSAGKESGYLGWSQNVTGNTEWQHLTAAWSSPSAGGDGKMRLYIDGICQETTLAYAGGTNGMLRGGTTAICGCINESFGGFQGTLEDLRFYDRALTENEVMTVYGMNGSDGITNGLVLWYPFKDSKAELASGFVQDQSGMKNHGKVLGAPAWMPAGDNEAKRKRRERFDATRELMQHKRPRGEAQRQALAKWLGEHPEGMEKWNARFAELNQSYAELKTNPIGWTFNLARGYEDLYAQVGMTKLFSAVNRYVTSPGGYGTNDIAGGYTSWAGAATNIQWAVNAASYGDTVWVTNGTYYLTNQIDIQNGITVRSVNGRDKTIVNGNYPGCTNRCFHVTGGGALVQGFTITNGYTCGASGAGIYLGNGATARDCLISGNTARDGNGGGVIINGPGTVDLCSVIGNVSTGNITGGGGVYTDSGMVTNCIIAWNSAIITNVVDPSGGGGGVLCYGGGTIRNCVISSNLVKTSHAWSGGGGVSGAGSVYDSIISGNSNSVRGGGTYGCTIIQNCLISGNWANTGSGICMSTGGGTVRNCTIVGNRNGYGFYYAGQQNSKLENCIIYSNYNTAGDTIRNWLLEASITNKYTNFSISNCCTYPTNFHEAVQASGCISNDPAFVNYPAGNYRLATNSPCINAGLNQDWMPGTVDPDGRQRIMQGTVDIGAYECDRTTSPQFVTSGK